MFQERFHAARQFAGLAIVLFVAVAAAVTGLTPVGGGVSPRVAATLAVAHALLPGG
jgi:hypothetical protein